MIHVGTSGYSYDDWVGPYYPPGTSKTRFLDHYARDFDCCEINYTYYSMPGERTMESMAARTGAGFRFAVKAHGDMTHCREKATPEVFERFVAGMQPLIAADKFACILAQFPNSFKPTAGARDFLERFRELIPELAVVVEFRAREWATEHVFEFLRNHHFGFCCVDEPRFESLIPPLALATSETGYLRFHGRNYKKWWSHSEAWERYNYLYSREELSEWLPKLDEIQSQGAKEILVFFNNHYQAQAVQNAQMFLEMLQEAGAKQAGA